mgnify:CR=1 FL=1
MMKKRGALSPIEDEEYLDEINSIDMAIKIALETRKFEIELYWKRATYFWAFLVSAFGIYFFIYRMDNTNNILDKNLLLIFSSSVGLLLSLCFYFVNRGSKYWQENWETQLDILLVKRIGPVFTRVKNPTDRFWNLLRPYPFSVSKVNILLSILMIVIWIILFIFSVILLWKSETSECIEKVLCIILTLATCLFTVIFFRLSKSFVADSVGIYSDEFRLLKK